jgi:hypothetical protein
MAARNFLYRGPHGSTGEYSNNAIFDSNKRVVILQKIPFQITLDDYFVIQNRRHDIESTEELGYGAGWLFVTSAVEGEMAYEIIEVQASNNLLFVAEVNHVEL